MDKCSVSIRAGGGFLYSRPCSRTAIVERNGKWFCGIHDPFRIRARYEEKVTAQRKQDLTNTSEIYLRRIWSAVKNLKTWPENSELKIVLDFVENQLPYLIRFEKGDV